MADFTLTRRQFLRATGAGVAGTAAFGLTACTRSARAAPAPPTTRSFLSDPTLRPTNVVVTKQAAGVAPGLLFLTIGGPLVVDNRGEPVWFKPLGATASTNLRVQQYQGAPVLTWWEGTVSKRGFGTGEYVIADTTYNELRRVAAGDQLQGDLHEFVITPEGTALLTAYSPAAADLTSVGGSAHGQVLDSIVQELDLATGQVVLEWRASEHVGVAETHTTLAADPTDPFDFFHVNSINVDHDGHLLVSARNTWAVYKLHRQTGAVLWRLGGKRSTFAMGAGTRFAWQHDAQRRSDGTISMFDDGAQPQVEALSRGLTLTVDEVAHRVEVEHAYTHPHLLAGSQGNMQTLSNGNVLVGWGALPNLSEFSQDGALLFDARFPSSAQSYRAFRFPWTGRPTTAPAVAVTRPSPGRVQAHASWNGATDVARWVLLGGATPAALAPRASALRSGFETVIDAAGGDAFVAVRAVDRRGAALATSAPAAV